MFSRTKLLIGEEAFEKIEKANIIVFGLGGVGGYIVEALIRSGIKNITIVDNDVVDISNINRQIIATTKTIGMKKTKAFEERIKEINPVVNVKTYEMFYLPDNSSEIDLEGYDYVIDAIDTITSKIDLAVRCNDLNIPIISSMGTGNKLNPMMFEIADIYKTSVCPVAKVMRRELKKRNIKHLKVLYSKEESKKIIVPGFKNAPGSISFTPSAAGLIIASEVIKDLIK